MSCTSCANCLRKFGDSEPDISLFANDGKNDCICQGCVKEYRRVNETAEFLYKVRAKKGKALGPAAIPLAHPCR